MSNASVVVPVSELTFPKRRSDEIVFIKSSYDALRAANKHLPRSRLPRVINYENVNRQRILLIKEKQEDKMKKVVSQRHESLAKMFLNEVQRKKARWAKEKAFFMMGLTLDSKRSSTGVLAGVTSNHIEVQGGRQTDKQAVIKCLMGNTGGVSDNCAEMFKPGFKGNQ